MKMINERIGNRFKNDNGVSITAFLTIIIVVKSENIKQKANNIKQIEDENGSFGITTVTAAMNKPITIRTIISNKLVELNNFIISFPFFVCILLDYKEKMNLLKKGYIFFL
ncbi:hypothetical protein B4088_0345 [Bacillus cereus]|uniref:Uncharacterized protein n=1 Tax=Bacillus cereus TaxID=1396 RepID=A0A161T9Z6_BACCE|nr:hypothetical protein B4088_0345 [Bacillus cereus]